MFEQLKALGEYLAEAMTGYVALLAAAMFGGDDDHWPPGGAIA